MRKRQSKRQSKAGKAGKADGDVAVDGKGLNHRFAISAKDQTVKYRSRESCAVQIEKEHKLGRSSAVTFAQPPDPCQRLFSKFFVAFKTAIETGSKREPSDVNVNVVLNTGSKSLTAQTDANLLQRLDPVTLEPLEATTYASMLPELNGPLSAAHGATVDGTTYNYVLALGPRPKYTLFHFASDDGSDARVLATITDAPPAYLHSLAATAKHVVLTIWQADYKHYGLDILWQGNCLDGLGKWDPKRRTLHYVFDRATGKRVARVQSDAFFAFHHINAFDDDDGKSIVLDLATYADTEVLNTLRVANMRAFDAATAPEPRYTRVRLPLDKSGSRNNEATVSVTAINIELPCVHPAHQWRAARYAYGVHRTDAPASRTMFVDAIVRLDMETRETRVWRQEGQVPGEPIFVPGPSGREDDGALLTVVLDVASQSSRLVILDAVSLEPVASADLATVFPNGFHGVFQS